MNNDEFINYVDNNHQIGKKYKHSMLYIEYLSVASVKNDNLINKEQSTLSRKSPVDNLHKYLNSMKQNK